MTSKKYHNMIHPRSKDYSVHETNLRAIRNLASSAIRKCAQCTVAHGERKNPPSVYEVGETALIRYPCTKKSVSKRHVLKADVVDRKVPKHKHKVKFVSPTTGKLNEKWISVSDITSLTIEREKRKRKAATKMFARGKKRKKPTARNIFIVTRIRGPYLKIEQARPISLSPLIPQKMEIASLQLFANF